MAAHARTWSPVTIALVRQLTPVSPAPRRTAPLTTPVVKVVSNTLDRYFIVTINCSGLHFQITFIRFLEYEFIVNME